MAVLKTSATEISLRNCILLNSTIQQTGQILEECYNYYHFGYIHKLSGLHAWTLGTTTTASQSEF